MQCKQHVEFIGYISRIEKKESRNSDADFCTFTITILSGYKAKNGEYVNNKTYINSVAFNGVAKYITDKITDGCGVAIEGEFNTNKYTDKDGNEKSNLQFVAKSIIKLVDGNSNFSEQTSKPEVTSEQFDDEVFF